MTHRNESLAVRFNYPFSLESTFPFLEQKVACHSNCSFCRGGSRDIFFFLFTAESCSGESSNWAWTWMVKLGPGQGNSSDEFFHGKAIIFAAVWSHQVYLYLCCCDQNCGHERAGAANKSVGPLKEGWVCSNDSSRGILSVILFLCLPETVVISLSWRGARGAIS